MMACTLVNTSPSNPASTPLSFSTANRRSPSHPSRWTLPPRLNLLCPMWGRLDQDWRVASWVSLVISPWRRMDRQEHLVSWFLEIVRNQFCDSIDSIYFCNLLKNEREAFKNESEAWVAQHLLWTPIMHSEFDTNLSVSGEVAPIATQVLPN